MNRTILVSLLICLLSLNTSSAADAAAAGKPVATTATADKVIASPEQNKRSGKDIELVFVIDTTGSMGGLIQGAKTKIWTIVNSVLQNQKKGTMVKIGLVAYRDRGDDYITKTTALSENLDEIYSTLMGFQAQGGGDTPEDVRRALYEGVRGIQWSKPRKNLSQIVFLVGDAPPHDDYSDNPPTVSTARSAKQRGIIINTIQCGNIKGTDVYWREIAQYGGGEYFAIPQDGGTYEITTPYDTKLASLAQSLDKTYIPYGSIAAQTRAKQSQIAAGTELGYATDEAKASRAVNKSINAYAYSQDDLIQSIENKSVKLGDIKKDELPQEMQKMNEKERENYVTKLIAERKGIKEEILKLSKERDGYIKENTKADNSGFDAAVSAALKKQIK